MRLVDWLLGRPVSAAARPPQSKLEARKDDAAPPIGGAGTSNYQGYLVPDEYNQDLRWPQSLDVWERMRRSDPAVREALWHVIAPIMAADRTIEPPDEPDDLELEVTEFIRCAFFEWMDQPFEEFLHQAMSFLTMGHAVFEPLFKVTSKSLHVKKRMSEEEIASETKPEANGKPPMENGKPPERFPVRPSTAAAPPASNGGPPQDPAALVPTPTIPEPMVQKLPERTFVTLRKLSQRLPKTIIKWNVDRAGELISVVQQAPITQADGTQTYEEVEIPASYLLVLVNEKWGDEWTGHSILRAAYKPWVLKEMLERVMGIAYERHGAGIPTAYVPESRGDDTSLLDELEEKLTNLRAGEFSFLLFPGPKSTGNMPGYNFDIEAPPGGIPDFTKALDYLRGEIKGSMLIRFSELGHGQAGARATASTQAEVWYSSLTALAEMLATQLDTLIRRLVDVNYENVERYPRLRFSGIKARNMLEFAQAHALLTNAQLLEPDTPLRDHIRRELDAPAEDPDEAKLREETNRQMFALDKGVKGEVFKIEEDPSETARPRTSKTNTPD